MAPHGTGTRAEPEHEAEGIQPHMALLASMDLFTVEVLTWRGLVTHYVLVLIHLESRRVGLAGVTRHPDEGWMQQMARKCDRRELGISRPAAFRPA